MKKNLKSKVRKEFYRWQIEIAHGKIVPFKENMIPENAVGFVYIMNMKDEKGKMHSYIGKKNFYSRRKKKFGKKKLAAMTDKRAKKYEIVIKPDYEKLL